MNNLKNQGLTALALYIILYFSSSLSNPLIPLNILEALFMAILIFSGFGFSYLLFFTNIFNYQIKTKNTIMSLYILFVTFISFYKPISFSRNYNIYLGNSLALVLIVLAAIILYWWLRSISTSPIILLIFLPSFLQGILMRSSQKLFNFYAKNPNITLYILLIFALIYYIISYYKKNKN